jgi:DNA-binding NtrC family response regulator
MKATVLVVEDEEKLRSVIELQLKTAGYEVEQAGTAEEALKLADRADVIITDLRLPGISGLELLQQLRSQDSRTPVIVMTAFGSIETAVEAMKAGAVDFLPKPFSLDHLMTVVNKALEVRTLRDENRELRAELSQRYEFDNIIGRSAAMREIFATIERVAPTRATVLLCGESGVGKDMIARAIHHHSPRDNKPVRQNQLHGAAGKSDGERAVRLRKGRVHRRQSSASPASSSRPTRARFSWTRSATCLPHSGEAAAHPAGSRVRAAGQQQSPARGCARDRGHQRGPARGAGAGRFREDLYYRLNVLPLNIPPLRERKEDIPLSGAVFCPQTGQGSGQPRGIHFRRRH